jgi:hypothetical protein
VGTVAIRREAARLGSADILCSIDQDRLLPSRRSNVVLGEIKNLWMKAAESQAIGLEPHHKV